MALIAVLRYPQSSIKKYDFFIAGLDNTYQKGTIGTAEETKARLEQAGKNGGYKDDIAYHKPTSDSQPILQASSVAQQRERKNGHEDRNSRR